MYCSSSLLKFIGSQKGYLKVGSQKEGSCSLSFEVLFLSSMNIAKLYYQSTQFCKTAVQQIYLFWWCTLSPTQTCVLAMVNNEFILFFTI